MMLENPDSLVVLQMKHIFSQGNQEHDKEEVGKPSVSNEVVVYRCISCSTRSPPDFVKLYHA